MTLFSQAAAAFVLEALAAKKPTAARLPLDFADALNEASKILQESAKGVLVAYAKKQLDLSEEHIDGILHRDLAFRSPMALTCPPRVESAVEWTAPLEDAGMRETKKAMNDAQAKVLKHFLEAPGVKDRYVLLYNLVL